MPAHWTYEGFDGGSDLEQGDILLPNDDLTAIFKEAHPHFCAPKYIGFLVATQSCDLVQRSGGMKAAHISLAAIRALTPVVPKILSYIAKPIDAEKGVFATSTKYEAKNLLRRLFNQSEQALGLFYLHPDADSGIAEPSVGFLRVVVAVRSDHYDALRAARKGRISAEFRAKLGWLLGNLYARPATVDWSERAGGTTQLDALLDEHLSEQIPERGPKWVDDEIIAEARTQGVALPTDPQKLEALRPKARHDQALDEIATQLSKVAPDFPAEQLQKLRNRLANSAKFRKLFKQAQP